MFLIVSDTKCKFFLAREARTYNSIFAFFVLSMSLKCGIKPSNNAKPITILLDDKPIGFFVLDYGEDKYDLTPNENSLLLRSLSINQAFQGNSYGKIAMNLVDDFVKTYYPTLDELVLAVNFKNTSAYQLYIKVGYTDDGSQREWNNGMQHLLRKKLK